MAESEEGTMRFKIEVSTGKLYNGRRSFFAVIQLGRRSYWLQRWDTARVDPKPNAVILHRGKVMTWNAGTH